MVPLRRRTNQSQFRRHVDWRIDRGRMPILRDNERQSSDSRGLTALVARHIPEAISPDHLTYAGLVGAILVAIGFIASRWSNWFLALVALGLACNWLSENLVRAVSESRGAARPLYGYFIDNSADLVAQTLIIMALGFSPYFHHSLGVAHPLSLSVAEFIQIFACRDPWRKTAKRRIRTEGASAARVGLVALCGVDGT